MCPRPIKTQKKKDEEIKYLEGLITDIARVFNVDLELIKEGDTKGMCALVRKIFYYIGKTKGNYPYVAMALVAGRISHTACIHHFRQVTDFIKDKDPDFMVLWEHYLENSDLFTKKDFQ
jgi:chromosomal replication initiation ATPase DnaA